MKSLRMNKVEEKQLLKKLEQLNIEEARNRLKYDRLATDLIFFLKENRETTGYLSTTYPSHKKSTKLLINKDINEKTIDNNEENEINELSEKKHIRPLTANPNLLKTRLISLRRKSAPAHRIDHHERFSHINGTSTPINRTSSPNDTITLSPVASPIGKNAKKNQIFLNEILEVDDKKKIEAESVEQTGIQNVNSSNNRTNNIQSKIVPSSASPESSKLFSQTKQNDNTIKISTNNRYLMNNNKLFKGKFSFDFINNTRIRVSMSKSYIRKEKVRIIYENKVIENAKFLESLNKIQSVFDSRVKQFSQTIMT